VVREITHPTRLLRAPSNKSKMTTPVKYTISQRVGQILAALSLTLIFISLIPALWVFIAFNAKYRSCVQLPNGMHLGYEAVFDLSRPYLKPIAVPKYSDGTPLIRKQTWAIYVTETTLYGSTMNPDDTEHRFAWRADAGLVLRKTDSKHYDSLIAEAGQANKDIGAGQIGAGAALNRLLELKQSNVQKCPTALITW
jgi:hypothetical protein